MEPKPSQLWNAWRTSAEVRQNAEAWLAKRDGEWTDAQELLAAIIHSTPDDALATIFGIMQLTDDPDLLGSLGAGPLEEFLGVHGDAYVDCIHELALQYPRLREVLNDVWQGSMSKLVWRRIEMLKQSAFS